MIDYLKQCNAMMLLAEKKVWRWARHVSPNGATIVLYREDCPGLSETSLFWPRTEYLGDADGTPIQAMLGPQELWDRHGIRIGVTPHGKWWGDRVLDGYEVTSSFFKDTYAAALAEANRIAGASNKRSLT